MILVYTITRGKANVVVDALSRKSYANMALGRQLPTELCKEFEKLNLGWVTNTQVVAMEVESTLEQDIRKGQLEDEKIKDIIELIKIDKALGFHMDEQGTIWFEK
jgi:hypothetical protein